MHISESDIEVLWEGEADQSSLERRFVEYMKQQTNSKENLIHGDRHYKVYTDTCPPEYIGEYQDFNLVPSGNYKILILEGDTYINYLKYEKAETLS